MHGRSGDTVHIHQSGLEVSVAVKPRLEASHFECFAAKDDVNAVAEYAVHEFLQLA